MILLGALLACSSSSDSATPGWRTVQIQVIDVQIQLDPQPDEVVFEDPEWIHFHHCGHWTLEGDRLIAHGGLDPEIGAIALVNYGSWGGLFSGGGTQQLEVDLSDGAAPIQAALRVQDVLYELSIDDPDTGVPGGETSYWYPANDFPGDVTAQETHIRYPRIEARVVEEEPKNCAR